MSEEKNNVLIIELKGMPVNEGHVALSDLSTFTTLLKKFLDILKTNNNESKASTYKIISATHNSPLTLGIEPSINDSINHFDPLYDFVDSVRNENINENDYPVLKAYNDIVSKLDKNFTSISLITEKSTANISRTDKEKAKKLIGTTQFSYGSVTGRIEKLNIHGDNSNFTIYPLIGNEIKCIVPNELKDEVASHVKRRVVMTGKISYSMFSDFPIEIKVKEVELLPKDDKLPSFGDLYGTYPKITGDLTTNEYLQKQKDGYINEF